MGRLRSWTSVLVFGCFALARIGAGDVPSDVSDPPLLAIEEGRGIEPTAPPTQDGDSLGESLIPGLVIQPIQPALRLAGARDLDIAIARERIGQALAALEQARILWLSCLYLGPNWIRHDSQAQTVQGPVQPISKGSLFLGATAAARKNVTGPIPAGGPALIGAGYRGAHRRAASRPSRRGG